MVQLEILALISTVLAAVLAPSHAFVFAPAASTAGAGRIGAKVCCVIPGTKYESSPHGPSIYTRNTSTTLAKGRPSVRSAKPALICALVYTYHTGDRPRALGMAQADGFNCLFGAGEDAGNRMDSSPIVNS